MVKLFQEFETYFRHNRQLSTSKLEHLRLFAQERIYQLYAIIEIVNEYTGQHINRRSFDYVDTEKVDYMKKFIKYYFNQKRNRAAQIGYTQTSSDTTKPAPAPIV